MAFLALGQRIATMPIRYEYDLDHNGEWRWIAVAESGETKAISPVGYVSLQDCMHAIGLMQAPGNLAVMPGAPAQASADPPESTLSSLHRRPSAA
jgi:uncharacterized protein YegP (UPF0339 family)